MITEKINKKHEQGGFSRGEDGFGSIESEANKGSSEKEEEPLVVVPKRKTLIHTNPPRKNKIRATKTQKPIKNFEPKPATEKLFQFIKRVPSQDDSSIKKIKLDIKFLERKPGDEFTQVYLNLPDGFNQEISSVWAIAEIADQNFEKKKEPDVVKLPLFINERQIPENHFLVANKKDFPLVFKIGLKGIPNFLRHLIKIRFEAFGFEKIEVSK